MPPDYCYRSRPPKKTNQVPFYDFISCIPHKSWRYHHHDSLRRSFKQLKISAMMMNLPTLIPLRQEQVKNYIPQAVALTLGHPPSQVLSKEQKSIVSKIYTNLNTICKLSIKQVKELIKQEPGYQQALADLYFDKKINNYMLINQHQKTTNIVESPLLDLDNQQHPNQVVNLQYRIQFTVSNIAKKNVMKPVVLLVFFLKNGQKRSVYFNLDQFALLRQQVSKSMSQIFGVELRAL